MSLYPTNEAESPSRAYVIVHEDVSTQRSEEIARLFSLETIHLSDLSNRSLETAPRLIVDIDLRNLATVQAFRSRIGKGPPAIRNWAFWISSGSNRRASLVQANALGATMHLSEEHGAAELTRLLSIARDAPVAAGRLGSLKTAPGGVAILAAGRELARLFGGLMADQEVAMGAVSEVSTEIVRSVELVGAEAWLSSVRDHHEGTFQHCLLVTGTVAGFIARNAGSEAIALRLTQAALLHDVGKAVVPLHILDKPGRLNEQEFAVIKRHPEAGHNYLANQQGIDPQVLDAVLHHHEELNGSGYPHRLTGSQIKPVTRILTVCDIFAALIEVRAYRAPMTPEEAIATLTKMAMEGKVDYSVVRDLAHSFDMCPPETMPEVQRNLLELRTAQAK